MISILKDEYDKLRLMLGHNVKKTFARETKTYCFREGVCSNCGLNIRIKREFFVDAHYRDVILTAEILAIDSLDFKKNLKQNIVLSKLDSFDEWFKKSDEMASQLEESKRPYYWRCERFKSFF